MNRKLSAVLIVTLLLSLSCTCMPSSLLGGNDQPQDSPTQPEYVKPTSAPLGGNQQPTSVPQQNPNAPTISPIVFCEGVDASGNPINPSASFPGGTTSVSAYFTFRNMHDGMNWGRLWKKDGEVFVDARSDVWEDDQSGWVFYSISEENNMPMMGEYALTIYLEGEIAQTGRFSVEHTQFSSNSGDPAIGAIIFAPDITDDIMPISSARVFEEGITQIYAVFPFINMRNGMSFSHEWILDDEVNALNELTWAEGQQGMDYAYIYADEPLSPGNWYLNLYIDDELAAQGDFTIQSSAPAQPAGPAEPEEIIDGYMMPAWENLAYSQQEVLRDLADFSLRNHVEIRVDPNYEGKAHYVYSCSEPPVAGAVLVSLDYWNNTSWAEVTAALGHELTHAVQHLSGNYRCGCSIEKEYYAYITQFYVLQEMDRMDIIEDKYSGCYDPNTGEFDGDQLWEVLKDVYTDCPEY